MKCSQKKREIKNYMHTIQVMKKEMWKGETWTLKLSRIRKGLGKIKCYRNQRQLARNSYSARTQFLSKRQVKKNKKVIAMYVVFHLYYDPKKLRMLIAKLEYLKVQKGTKVHGIRWVSVKTSGSNDTKEISLTEDFTLKQLYISYKWYHQSRYRR